MIVLRSAWTFLAMIPRVIRVVWDWAIGNRLFALACQYLDPMGWESQMTERRGTLIPALRCDQCRRVWTWEHYQMKTPGKPMGGCSCGGRKFHPTNPTLYEDLTYIMPRLLRAVLKSRIFRQSPG